MIKNKFYTIFIVCSMLMVSGCSVSFKSNNAPVNDAGIFKTTNKGETWSQKVLIPTVSGIPGSIGPVNVNVLVMDPSDNNAIYIGSAGTGLYYTYDGANSWNIARGLGQKTINNVAIDPGSKCIIYATIGNELFKSSDCNRTWKSVYVDNNNGVSVNAVAIDHYDNNVVYIGTSRGEIIKSSNRGETWHTLNRFKANILRIVISPHDSRNIFAIIPGSGIHRSYDSGASWENLNEGLKEFGGGGDYKDMVFSEIDAGLLYLTVRYGILKSTDNGDTWKSIELITPERDATINAITVNPKNTDEIYYVTKTTFYRSSDGGKNWTPKKLPTSGAGWKLLINPSDPSTIYMGVKK